MKTEDLVEEKSSDISSRIGCMTGAKVNLLRQFVNENGDGIVAMCCPWKVNDKAHGYSLPSLRGDLQGCKETRFVL